MPTVLIADDEPIVRRLLREILSIDSTFTFIEAENGVKALEAARAVSPHLIILDIMMPQLDGLQVCRLVKVDPALRAIPVLLITALSNSDSEIDAHGAGADAFVRKPFDEEELLATVTWLLKSRAG